MQPQDAYDRGYNATTARLDAWLATVGDAAVLDHERTPQYWRARLLPRVANTCSVELLLSRSQRFDIEIGSEGLVDQPVQDFDLFLSLFEAVSSGNVVRREWSAAGTGAPLFCEMVVRLDNGRSWTLTPAEVSNSPVVPMTARIHAYVPYRLKAGVLGRV